jgi:N-acetylneuraminic acid mutarotase
MLHPSTDRSGPHSRAFRLLARPAGVLGALAIFAGLTACTDDSSPTQPDATLPAAQEPAALQPAAPVGDVPAGLVLNSWMSKQSMPTARFGSVTATVNGVIYAIGGRNLDVSLATVESYNPNLTLFSWKAKASLPAPRAWVSGAVTINGKIYVPGGVGADFAPTNTLFLYRPATNTWVQKASMPVNSYGGAAVAINGKLYVVTPTGNNTLLHRYDPATNAWTARATGPVGHYHPVAGVINGKLYVAGTLGSNNQPSHLVSMYDPATNSWLAKAAMPEDQIGAGGRVMNGKLYAVGGYDEEPYLGARSIVYAYSPATDSWVKRASMPAPRGWVSVASANGLMYALGGHRNLPLATNQAYIP